MAKGKKKEAKRTTEKVPTGHWVAEYRENSNAPDECFVLDGIQYAVIDGEPVAFVKDPHEVGAQWTARQFLRARIVLFHHIIERAERWLALSNKRVEVAKSARSGV